MKAHSVLVVTGPTASGKSALALHLARRIEGEIVNADTIQCFKGFDIGSAKPSREDRALVPHHLFDIASPDQDLNAARYVEIASQLLGEIFCRGKSPIVVGSSGMYLSALLSGLSPLPDTSPEFRQSLESRPTIELYRELCLHDAKRGQDLHPNDRVRIVRALEIIHSTGMPASNLLDNRKTSQLYDSLILVVVWPRKLLRVRIEERVRVMIEEGILSESKNLRQEFGPTRLFQSIGYREALEVLDGELSVMEFAIKVATRTNQYAKRQLTYWANEPRKRGWISLPPQPPYQQNQEKNFSPFRWNIDQLVNNVIKRRKEPFPINEVWYVCGLALFGSDPTL